MDQREDMTLPGSDSYYMHLNRTEPFTNPSSNPAVHFQSNAGDNLTVPTAPLDTLPTMSGHGFGLGQPSGMLQGQPVRRKRGRPRKYGHGGPGSFAPIVRPTPKTRGAPPGISRKQQLSSLGGSLFNGAGTLTPHFVNIAIGEDIKRKIMSLLQGRGAIVVLSGIGSISAANIKISSSSQSITYEGRFDMLNLSGSYINDIDGPHILTGGLTVTLAGSDGRVIGGPVEDFLVAATPVQVIVGSLSSRNAKPKIKDVEDPDLNPANVQSSQNLSPMGFSF